MLMMQMTSMMRMTDRWLSLYAGQREFDAHAPSSCSTCIPTIDSNMPLTSSNIMMDTYNIMGNDTVYTLHMIHTRRSPIHSYHLLISSISICLEPSTSSAFLYRRSSSSSASSSSSSYDLEDSLVGVASELRTLQSSAWSSVFIVTVIIIMILITTPTMSERR